jgi:uncharacterized repeat protein (TIGR01451 family)
LDQTVQRIHPDGWRHTAEDHLLQDHCLRVTAGEYAARATISEGENYSGSGASTFRIADPRTLSADLLVGFGVDKLNVKQGDLMTYTITVRNFGPDPAYNAVVNDTLSSASTFVLRRSTAVALRLRPGARPASCLVRGRRSEL